jgi:hypothetical protein
LENKYIFTIMSNSESAKNGAKKPLKKKVKKKIRMPTKCEALLLRVIRLNSGALKRYSLWTHAKLIPECKEEYKQYEGINRLVKRWEEDGLIEMRPIAMSVPDMYLATTQKGNETSEFWDRFFSPYP